MDTVPAPVYLGVDHEPAELGDVLDFLATELGLPRPPSESAGAVAAGAAGAAAGGASASGASASGGKAAGGEPSRGGNKRASSGLLRSTGFEFQYPSFREGYRAVLAGVGARHP